MCEILFNIRDNTHSDPEKERRGSWKRGMPVMVKPDGHTWGRLESKQQWIAEGNAAADWPSQGVNFILKLPGVPVERAEEFISPQVEDDAGTPVFDPLTGMRIPYRRRRWRLKEELVPNPVKQTIAQTGEYTTTPAAIRNYLRRIRDDAQYTGFD